MKVGKSKRMEKRRTVKKGRKEDWRMGKEEWEEGRKGGRDDG